MPSFALAVALLSFPLVAAPPAASPPTAAEAVALYDSGDYAAAARALRALDAAGRADGPLLYRLFFCHRVENDLEGARAMLDRARTALESENVPGAPIEVPFYLANAYANLGRAEDARRVAEETLDRLDARGFRPGSAMEWFQLAKLRQDAGRNAAAEEAYRGAVEGFAKGPASFPGQERWARRFLGESASARADWREARVHWARVAELADAGRADFLELATAAARTGAWEEAAEAWRRAEKIDMRIGSDPRYASALARQAAALGSLPTTDSAGRAIASLDPEALEETMRGAAAALRAKREEAAGLLEAGRLDAEARDRLDGEIRVIRGVFVAAGIEYAVRRLPIRETAFRDQLGTLVFQDAEWRLPEPPPDPER